MTIVSGIRIREATKNVVVYILEDIGPWQAAVVRDRHRDTAREHEREGESRYTPKTISKHSDDTLPAANGTSKSNVPPCIGAS
jgi:hypothetical protein